MVAVGGGGIPITEKGAGIEAVIDKDRAASLLASQILADTLVFVTSVDGAYADFGKRSQRLLRRINVEEALDYSSQGHFAEGSMKPKVESAACFLSGGGKRAVICSIKDIKKALAGKAGTTIVP